MLADGDGFIVQSIGMNGVVTCRRFRSRRRAEAELGRIDRVAELNRVAAGEQTLVEASIELSLQEACRRVGVEMGWNPVDVYRLVKERRNGATDVRSEELDEAERLILRKVEAAIDFGGISRRMADLRESVEARYHVDIDAALSKERNRRDGHEQAAIDEYERRCRVMRHEVEDVEVTRETDRTGSSASEGHEYDGRLLEGGALRGGMQDGSTVGATEVRGTLDIEEGTEVHEGTIYSYRREDGSVGRGTVVEYPCRVGGEERVDIALIMNEDGGVVAMRVPGRVDGSESGGVSETRRSTGESNDGTRDKTRITADTFAKNDEVVVRLDDGTEVRGMVSEEPREDGSLEIAYRDGKKMGYVDIKAEEIGDRIIEHKRVAEAAEETTSAGAEGVSADAAAPRDRHGNELAVGDRVGIAGSDGTMRGGTVVGIDERGDVQVRWDDWAYGAEDSYHTLSREYDLPYVEKGEFGVTEGADTAERGISEVRGEGEGEKNKPEARVSETEVDEQGNPLILAKDGSTEFGSVDAESGLTAAPIRLSLGENRVDEQGNNHGYGLLHIEAGHGEEIRNAGYGTVEEFVEEVAKNYTDIREGGMIGNRQTYLLEVSDSHNNTLFIQLSRDGSYWNVNSAGIFRKTYSRRKPKVYTVPAVGGGTDTDTPEVNSGQAMGATAPAGNSLKTSDGKVSEKVLEKQGEVGKSSEGGSEPVGTTALGRVPRDDRGEPMFEAVDASTGWDALVEYCEGDATVAKEIADAMVLEKEKALAKARKQQVKGKTPAEMFASNKANAAVLDKAQKEYEQWRGIATERSRREQEVAATLARYKEALEAQRAQEDSALAESKAAAEAYVNDPEAHDAWEYVALDLVGRLLGGDQRRRIGITPESWQSEYGGLMSERRRLPVGVIRTKENGGVSIAALADIIWESGQDSWLHNYDSNDVRGMIIDMLPTLGGLKEEVKARRRASIEEEDADRYYRERYGMSRDDYYAYEEQLFEEMVVRYSNFDEQEFYGNLADEYSQREKEDGRKEVESTGGVTPDGSGGEVLQGTRTTAERRDGAVAGGESSAEVGDGVPVHHPDGALSAGTRRGGIKEKGDRRDESGGGAATKLDKQGNPIDTEGNLVVEKVASVDDITDSDFASPKRTIGLPELPKEVSDAIGSEGKPVIIKKNIFEKNAQSHKDLSAEEGRQILSTALYRPDLYGQNQKATRPYNWILIHLNTDGRRHGAVVLEMNHGKDHVEIVNWHYLEDETLRQKESQAQREGGLILTLNSAAGDASMNLVSEGKGSNNGEDKQVNEGKSSGGVKRGLSEAQLALRERVFGYEREAASADGEARAAVVARASEWVKTVSKADAEAIWREHWERGRDYESAYETATRALEANPGDSGLKRAEREAAAALNRWASEETVLRRFAQAAKGKAEGEIGGKGNGGSEKGSTGTLAAVRERYEARVAELMAAQERQYEEAMAAYRRESADYDAAMVEWHRKAMGLPKGSTRDEVVAAGRALTPEERQALTAKWQRTRVYKEGYPKLEEAFGRVPRRPDAETEREIRYELEKGEFAGYDLGEMAKGEPLAFDRRSGSREDGVGGEQGGSRTMAERRAMGEAVAGLLKDCGIDVVVDGAEMRRVLGEVGLPEVGADIVMLEAAKRNPSTKPARGHKSSPTLSEGISRAKVGISDENRKALTNKVNDIHDSISEGLTGADFLRIVKKAFGFDEADNADRSEYVVNEIGGVNHTMRVANHHVSARTYEKRGELDNNTAVVIKMSDRRFRSDNGVSLVEYVYFPDRLTAERMHGIVDGLRDWVERGEYTHKDYDDRKVSGLPVDMGIKGRTEFLRTSKGEVYGFVKDGKVYIDPELINPNTPLHEYTHLWDRALQKANPKLWERGKDLMKQLPLWEEVVNDPAYSEIAHDEDLVASEVHSRLSGTDGARRLDEMVAAAKERGVIETAKAVTLKERIKGWLKDVLGWVRDAFGGKWGKKDLERLTIEEFAAMPLKDLARGMNPGDVLRKSNQVERINETNPMHDDYHYGIRGLEDVKTFDEVLEGAEKEHAEYGELAYPDIDINALRRAKDEGEIMVYSSKPIEDGNFVSTSRRMAENYAGTGKVYSKRVKLTDVAWLDHEQGQLASGVKPEKVLPIEYQVLGERGAEGLDAADRESGRQEAAVRKDNLGVARDMEARFKDIEGSEEHQRMVKAAEKVRKLDAVKVENVPTGKDEAHSLYKAIGKVKNEETGAEVEFYNSAFKKIHKEGGLFEKAIPALKEAFEKSVLAYSENDNLGGRERKDGTVHKEHKNIDSYDNYIGKVQIDGRDYYVRFTVQSQKDGASGTHAMFVTDVELYENPTESRTIPLTLRGTTDFNGIVDAKLRNFFMLASGDGKTFAQRPRLFHLRFRV